MRIPLQSNGVKEPQEHFHFENVYETILQKTSKRARKRETGTRKLFVATLSMRDTLRSNRPGGTLRVHQSK